MAKAGSGHFNLGEQTSSGSRWLMGERVPISLSEKGSAPR